ncbi:OsmC family protein [bacterium]|nr:OsmC family protein [bacterium]
MAGPLREEDIPAPEGLEPSEVCEGGSLDCGSGLLLLIRRSMDKVPGGEVLQINSTELSVCEDLPAWCRMTGNPYLGWRKAQGSNHFFVRRGAPEGSEAAAERQAREHRWQARVAWQPPLDEQAVSPSRVYSRNHSWEVGQPASFDLQDSAPSAVEMLLGALGACLAQGLQIRASRRGIELRNIEIQLAGQIDNIYVFLGLEDSGHAGFSWITATAYVQSSAPEDELQQLWQEVLAASPVNQTLLRPTQLELRLLAMP